MNAVVTGPVLIVDDDVQSARGLARLLKADGFAVELAFDGAAAVGRLAREPAVRVLITEVVMPAVGGMAIAAYARSRDPGVATLIVTAHPELVVRSEAGSETRVFTKPIDYASLRASLLVSAG